MCHGKLQRYLRHLRHLRFRVKMKYTKEITDKIVEDYKSGITVAQIANTLSVPDRSIIAKLSSLGVYQKKTYVNKRGEVPVKKYEMIEELAQLLEVPSDQLESLEKVNKSVLILLKRRLLDPKPQ
jgi:DNA-directed RNA polymerase specialized sigma subunit